MEEIKHSFVPTNGISLHIAEIGSGPLVLLLHGFPEIWYSWRHQMLSLSHNGFRAIAPDHRGYGLTQNTDPSKNDMVDIAHDIIGLLDAIGEETVFVVAKDWGAMVAYILGYLHPHRLKGLVILGIPMIKPTLYPSMISNLPAGHYVRRWAEPGVPEADFGRFDVATVIKRIYIMFCNSGMPIASENEQTLDLVKPSDGLPEWMTEEDLQVYADLYQKSGFKYPMEVPYRCWTRTAEKFSNQQDFTIQTPLLLIIGDQDYACNMPVLQQMMEAEQKLLPHAKVVHIEEGTHFVQEQLPKQVNQLMIDFLNSTK